MRVAVVPIDRQGVGHARALRPVWAAQAAGVDAVLFDASWMANEERFTDFDVVVFQVPLNAVVAGMIPHLQAAGTAVVVEIDDDYDRVHPDNKAFRLVQWETRPNVNRHFLALAASLADAVTVTTRRLQDVYGGHGRAHVVPNCVPAAWLDIPTRREPGRVIGWSGSVGNHPNDLPAVGSAVADLVAEDVAEMRTVGPPERVAEQLGCSVTSTGWVGPDSYPHELAKFDVGIVPLQRSLFNEAKSWLKGLEMSAVGVPFVATPTGPYRQLVRQGAGLIAETPDEWRHQLRRLLADDELRHELAWVGRMTAARWTFEGNVHRWVDAWVSAVEHRRKHPSHLLT